MKLTPTAISFNITPMALAALGALGALGGGYGCDAAQADNILHEVRPHIVAVDSGYSWAYVIDGPRGVVLIDAGLPTDAHALRRALSERNRSPADVVAILLTHGHRDHIGGAARFANAITYTHARDHVLIRGGRKPGGWLARILNHLSAAPPLPQEIVEVFPGAKLELGGLDFEVIGLAGHTPGSLAFLHDGVLFTGDALVGDGDELGLAPSALSDRPDQARRCLHTLDSVTFDTVADGHTGAIFDARARLQRLLGKLRSEDG